MDLEEVFYSTKMLLRFIQYVTPREIQFHRIKCTLGVHLPLAEIFIQLPALSTFCRSVVRSRRSKVVWWRLHTFKEHSCKQDRAAWHLLWTIKAGSAKSKTDQPRIMGGFSVILAFQSNPKRKDHEKLGSREILLLCFGEGCLSSSLFLPSITS